MEKWASKWLQCILRDKNFNEKGVQYPLSYSCLRRRFNPLAFNNPPFCIYISLYLVYGNVLCMIQTLIYIYSCNTVKVTKKTS